MKKSEKILIGTILLLFLGVLIFGHIFTTPLLISTSILSICYVIGGFYFLDYQKDKDKLNILAGLILGSALSIFTFTLWLPVSIFRKVLISINIIFSLTLIGLWFYKKSNFTNKLKYIFYRSIVIAIFTSFFSFSSIYFDTYRNILLTMVTPNSSVHNNLLMFDRIDKYEDSMNSKKYDKAITNAKEAILYGKEWRNYDTLYYQDFSGAYEFLADAYIANAGSFYDNKNYPIALKNYIKADSILTHKENKPKYIKSTESDIYWNRYNLLLTYNKLLDYDNYDSEFEYLIDNYLKVKDTVDIDYYYILENVTENFYDRSFYSDAISLNKLSLQILNQDSINNLKSFKNTYIRLIKNYLATDSIQNAKTYLTEYENIVSSNNCKYLLYKTSIYQKENIKEALKLAKMTCDCYKKENKPSSLLVSKILLLQLKLKNSDFKDFEQEILITQSLISKTKSKNYGQAYIDELLGQYNFIKGNYVESKKHYKKALDFFKNLNEVKKNLLELNIAQINDELNISYDKNSISVSVLNFLAEYETTYPSNTVFHNDLGNINIGFNSKLSDSIFKVTIECHKNFGISKSSNLGIAYNGLATNLLHFEKYKKADSLYKIAIKKLDDFYGKQKNVNQLVCYLNIIKSKLNQKKYIESLDFLKKARLTKTYCFNKDITIYDAYLLNLEGDIIKENQQNNSLAIEKYNQALDIAKDYFDTNHTFIKNIENKLKK
ncbi:hypothetical protein ACE939_08860 [Aquimarina sp. W85]|uniref:hypothetical protein n=1 Tax=Aquimarina rhodophyticola TaxID=3342246 RepID=UPI00366FF8E7